MGDVWLYREKTGMLWMYLVQPVETYPGTLPLLPIGHHDSAAVMPRESFPEVRPEDGLVKYTINKEEA